MSCALVSGVVTSVAGLCGTYGTLGVAADGTGTNALFYDVTGCVVNSAGVIYVNDVFFVRVVTTSGSFDLSPVFKLWCLPCLYGDVY